MQDSGNYCLSTVNLEIQNYQSAESCILLKKTLLWEESHKNCETENTAFENIC